MKGRMGIFDDHFLIAHFIFATFGGVVHSLFLIHSIHKAMDGDLPMGYFFTFIKVIVISFFPFLKMM